MFIRVAMIMTGVLCCGLAIAHVQVLTPIAASGAACTLDIRLVEHASQNGPLLSSGKPVQFGVLVNGKKTDLLAAVQAKESEGKPVFAANYTMTDAGAHVFYLQPAPYWEPAEQVMVTHSAKVIVNSCPAKLPTESHMGWENWEGWDALAGLPVEIEPMVQCTSLWTGSEFVGRVLLKGKPAPYCRVAIEYLNVGGALPIPDNSYLTHILKTNGQGEFSYVPVRAGWWAFTAIPETGETAVNPDGKMVKAELGGVLWVHCVDMK